jgi:hypothetical protein
MPPPTPPQTDLRGRPLDSKGRPLDAHDRPLDSFDRPIHTRVIEPTVDEPFPGYPNVIVSFPSFGDWQAMYDPRNNRGLQQNQVTYEDFKRRHQKVMNKALADIASRSAGKALLSETSSSSSFSITILPIDFVPTQKQWIKYHTNAIQSDIALHAMAKGMHVHERRTGGPNRKGTGRGSDAEIFFSPERLRLGGPGMNPDEVLFHEMVHAVRAIQGVSTSTFKMGGGYDNAEEFAAVVVTNVYMSEKKQTALRANHGSRVLPNPEKFLDSPDVPAPGARGLLGSFRLRQPTFFAALAGIAPNVAAFNPFRQLAAETVKANAAHEAKMRAFDQQQLKNGK